MANRSKSLRSACPMQLLATTPPEKKKKKKKFFAHERELTCSRSWEPPVCGAFPADVSYSDNRSIVQRGSAGRIPIFAHRSELRIIHCNRRPAWQISPAISAMVMPKQPEPVLETREQGAAWPRRANTVRALPNCLRGDWRAVFARPQRTLTTPTSDEKAAVPLQWDR